MVPSNMDYTVHTSGRNEGRITVSSNVLLTKSSPTILGEEQLLLWRACNESLTNII